MSTTHTTITSPLGELILVAEDGTLSGVYFPGHWTRPDPATFGARSEQRLEQVEQQLVEYFAVSALPLALRRSDSLHSGLPMSGSCSARMSPITSERSPASRSTRKARPRAA